MKKVVEWKSEIKCNRTFILLFGLTIFAVWFSSQFFFQLILIQGDSMLPTFHDKQFALIDKHSREYARGDVIAFYCDDLEAVLVKRIVGIPGDVVHIRGEILYVNNLLSEQYADDQFMYSGMFEKACALAENEYAVIGDNVNQSVDSRYEQVGLIREAMILGKIIK